MMGASKVCPGCGAVDTRVTFSGLGGRWKTLCSQCHYRFAECNGETAGMQPEPDRGEYK